MSIHVTKRNNIAFEIRKAAVMSLLMERFSGTIDEIKAMTRELEELTKEYKDLINRLKTDQFQDIVNQVFENIRKKQIAKP